MTLFNSPIRLQTVSAILLVVAFFLPWVNVMGFLAFNGMQIAQLSQGVDQLNQAMNLPPTNNSANLYFPLIYLVPLLGIAALVCDLSGRFRHAAGLLAGIFVIALFLIFAVQIGSQVLQIMTFGLYLTLLAAAGLVADVLIDWQTIENYDHPTSA